MTIPTPNRRSPRFWVDVFNSFRLTWRLVRDRLLPGVQVFIGIVPRALAQRHRDAMGGVAPQPGPASPASQEIIDG